MGIVSNVVRMDDVNWMSNVAYSYPLGVGVRTINSLIKLYVFVCVIHPSATTASVTWEQKNDVLRG